MFDKYDEFGTKTVDTENNSNENIDCSNEPKSGKFYECSEPNCGKMYQSLTSMKQHASSHTGGKDFSCAQCEKKFSQQSHLNVHIKVTGYRQDPNLAGSRYSHDPNTGLVH